MGHYKHSAKATQRLKDCQKHMELPSTSLIQDVDTRWNSEHAMLSRLVQLKDAVANLEEVLCHRERNRSNLLKSLKSRFPLHIKQKELALATQCNKRFKVIFFSTSYDHTWAIELLVAEITDRSRRIDSFQQSSRQELHCQPSISTKDVPRTVWETVKLLASKKKQCNSPGPYSQMTRSMTGKNTELRRILA
ncbi:hypothetical protein HPB47_020458 [Ixodes persulcatus]|uniref:Uncharacterized protein n=1 Tax=Ixodes persulcatus TaxID=34615 RepID=A0AC60QFI7_IXOPE|nr:hypothetical protein HPB47_020458 [Ixodes persulcatus]